MFSVNILELVYSFWGKLNKTYNSLSCWPSNSSPLLHHSLWFILRHFFEPDMMSVPCSFKEKTDIQGNHFLLSEGEWDEKVDTVIILVCYVSSAWHKDWRQGETASLTPKVIKSPDSSERNRHVKTITGPQ